MTHQPTQPPMSDFPILDSPRAGDPYTYPGRAILDFHGYIEPYVDEMDYWVAMPVRLVHTVDGLGIEIGPYSLDAADIMRLRAAIASYDQATGPTRRAVE
jgi:hypothetical protein